MKLLRKTAEGPEEDSVKDRILLLKKLQLTFQQIEQEATYTGIVDEDNNNQTTGGDLNKMTTDTKRNKLTENLAKLLNSLSASNPDPSNSYKRSLKNCGSRCRTGKRQKQQFYQLH